ncbi:pyridoxamine 5'-phosphate oxidase family protein [Acidiferrimicrobium sp. IK]|uniref:pyridoxamine 5'-phosphate oxidase family protein n=1 Tax=Acidiferrimicrobium sp. IK TaxID=2871700 RepID=UPI0021CB837E|nr:pyridoxamine 5'-phosphate oxidase family protein [Acidiferrimicrobium sp. IK]MCU4187439.1 pyridoxamine 5'-phosphate oxidase family protein [Acidiferrimicrobium sp. IK]
MRFDPEHLPPVLARFLEERHLATVTTLRPDGRPHVVPVGFTWDAATATARVITSGTSRKVANVEAAGGPGAHAVLCQVDGRRWVALEGSARVRSDAIAVAEAEAAYRRRYRQPRPNPARVVLELVVDRVVGSVPSEP